MDRTVVYSAKRRGCRLTIELLTVCAWNGPHMHSTDFLHPTWEQVEDAIRALDEQTYNDLYLCPDASNPGTYLAVGGGCGRYLVTGSVNNERFPTVIREVENNGVREALVVGGQAGDYPQNWILDLDHVQKGRRLKPAATESYRIPARSRRL